MTLTFLEKLEYGTSVTCSAIVLVFSFTAYRRTKLLPFALWIVASSISIVLMTGWYSHLHTVPASRADYETYMTIYRIGFFTNNILATIGSVMLIQHVLARFGSKMPPNTARGRVKSRAFSN